MFIVSLFTRVSIYSKLKFGHLWHYLYLTEYMPSCEKQVGAQKNCTRPLMLRYLQLKLKKYTLTHRQSLDLHGLDEEDEDPPQPVLP